MIHEEEYRSTIILLVDHTFLQEYMDTYTVDLLLINTCNQYIIYIFTNKVQLLNNYINIYTLTQLKES